MFELLYDPSPNLRNLKVFGFLVYSNTRPFNQFNLMNWSVPHVFIGYPDCVKGYLCFDPKSGKVIVSNDVLFMEDDFSQNAEISCLSNTSKDNLTRLNNGSPKSCPIGITEKSLTNLTLKSSQPSPSLLQRILTESNPSPSTSTPNIRWSLEHKLVCADQIPDMLFKFLHKTYHKTSTWQRTRRIGIERCVKNWRS